jgi:PadR family transcriptional regulator PadR
MSKFKGDMSISADTQTEEYLSNIMSEFLRGVMQLIILATIQEKEQSHGYEIIQEIFQKSSNLEFFTGGRKGEIGVARGIKLKEGSIYPHLNRLESDGYLSSTWNRNRKVYALTENGRVLLARIKALYHEFNEIVIKFI